MNHYRINSSGLLATLVFMIFIYAIPPKIYANTTVDSLRQVVKTLEGKEKVDALNQLAYGLKREPEKFHHYSKKAMRLAKKLNYPEGISEGYRNYQWFYQYPGTYNLDSSLYYSTLEIKYLESTPKLEMLGDAYAFRGRTYMIRREQDSAITYFRKAKKLFSAFDNNARVAQIYDLMGLLFYMKNDYQEAMNSFDSAHVYVKHTDNEKLKASINYHTGLTQFHLARHEEAINSIYKALDYYHKTNTTANIWNSYEILGNIYLTIENYEAAMRMHKKAFEIRKEAHKTRNIPDSINLAFAYSYNNIANVYLHQQKFDSALLLADKSLFIKLHPQSRASNEVIGNSYLLKSRIYKKMDSLNKSFEGLRQAKKYFMKDNDRYSISNALLVEAELFHKKGNHKRALSKADSALKMAIDIDAKTIQMNAHELIALFSMDSGNKSLAANHYLQYDKLRKQILNKEKLFSITELQLKKEKSNLETLINQQEAKLTSQQGKFKDSQKIWFAIVFILISGLLLLFWNRRKLRALLISATSQTGKSELIQRMRTEHNLQIVQSNLENNVDPRIAEKIISELKSSSKNTFDEDFLLIYQKVDKDFFPKLRKKHPNLTRHDQILCGMINMGLDSKQIAHITFRTPESIHVARSRLRKKLDLEQPENLTVYLQSM